MSQNWRKYGGMHRTQKYNNVRNPTHYSKQLDSTYFGATSTTTIQKSAAVLKATLDVSGATTLDDTLHVLKHTGLQTDPSLIYTLDISGDTHTNSKIIFQDNIIIDSNTENAPISIGYNAAENNQSYNCIALGNNACLLYTSDAADDSLRVDLGGRRIIKKSSWTIMQV